MTDQAWPWALWLKPKYTAAALNNYRLPGVKFVPIRFKSKTGYLSKNGVNAVLIKITDPVKYRPVTTGVAILCHLRNIYPEKFILALKNEKGVRTFNKAMGTDKVLEYLKRGVGYEEIIASWQEKLVKFNAKCLKYLIY